MNVTIELACPRWLKVAAKIAVPLAMIGTTGMALAGPTVFTAGETLKAADLNANFSDLDGRVTALEAAPTSLVSESDTTEGAGVADIGLHRRRDFEGR